MAASMQSLQLSAGAMRVDMGAGVEADEGANETLLHVVPFPPHTPPMPPPRNVALAALAANLRMKDLLSGYNLGNSKNPSRQVIRYRDKNLRMHGLKTLEDEVGLIAAMPQELAYKGLRPAGRRRGIDRRSLFATKRGLANAQNLGSVEELFAAGSDMAGQPQKKRRTAQRYGVAGEEDDDLDDLDDEEGGGLGGLRRADVEGAGDGSEEEDEEEAGYNSSDQEVEMDFDDHNDDDEEYEEDEEDNEAAF